MAVTDDQITLIQDALRALDITPGDRTQLSQDVAKGMENLVALFNEGKPNSEKLQYDPKTGYTPELGKSLLQRIGDFKAGDTFKKLSDAHNSFAGKHASGALLRLRDDVPAAMKRDPQKLFDLMDKAPQIIAGLDAVYEDAKVAVATPSAQPIQPSSTQASSPPAPAASEKPQVQSSSQPESEPEEEEIQRNVMGESYVVELALKELAPLLNKQLEEVSDKADEQINQLPEFMRDIAMAFRDGAAGGLLDKRIVEIEEADGIFSRRDQAALQGLLSILGNNKFIGDIGPIYSPAAGERIKERLPKLKETLKQYMDEEEYAAFEKELTDERVAQLTDALDFLHKEGKIWSGLLVDPNGNEIHDIPDYTEGIFQQRVDEFVETNPDMVRLLDALTHEYTSAIDLKNPGEVESWGINDIMSLDIQNMDIFETDIDVSNAAGRQKAIETFYASALAKHKKDGGTEEEFQSNVVLLINTVITLPYGEEAYRRGLQKSWMDATADGDAGAFAGSVIKSAAELREEYGDPEYKYFYQRDVPTWKPGLENFTVTSGGKTYTALDIAKIYDDKHVVQAAPEFRERGVSDVIENHSYYSFKDDNGDIYVAAIDKKSMVFSIEKIDVEKLKNIYFNEDKTRDEAVQEMLAVDDPGLALLPLENRGLWERSYENLFAGLEKTVSITQSGDWYKAEADKIRADAQTRADIEAKKNPTPYSTGPKTEVSSARPERDPSYVPPGERQDLSEVRRELQLLQNYAARRFTAPEMLRPEERAADLQTLNMLEKFEGQALRIGATYGQKFQVKGVEIENRNCDQPLMVWYDRRTATVQATAAPDYLIDEDKRQILKSALSGVDSADGFIHIKEKYPEFFEMAVGYRETRPLQDNVAPTMDEYLHFNRQAKGFLEKIEASMARSVDPEPEKSGWFSRQVNKVFGKSEEKELVNASSCFNHEAQPQTEVYKPEGLIEVSHAIGSDTPRGSDKAPQLEAPDVKPESENVPGQNM